MTKTSSWYLLLAFFLSFMGLVACHKDKTTNINGTVVDKVTGEPIDSASILISIYHEKIPPPNNYEYNYLRSNELGKFSFASSLPISIRDVTKEGYLSKGIGGNKPTVIQSEVNDITLEMIPKDGWLKLGLNNTGQSDTIYIGVYSPLKQEEFGDWPVVVANTHFFVQSMSSQNVILNLASEQIIDIYWGFSPLPVPFATAPFHGTSQIIRNDTTVFNITF